MTSDPILILLFLRRESTNIATASVSKRFRAGNEVRAPARARSDGENLHDVAARVQRFFVDQDELLRGLGIHLIVGHRNVNKMILKHLLGLSFEEGFRVEQEHQRLYFYFDASKELWSCWVEGTSARLARGYVTTIDSSYA